MNCTCGHDREEHQFGFKARCLIDDCDCPGFDYAGPEEPK